MKDFDFFKENSLTRDLCSNYSVAIAETMNDKRKLFELSLTNKGNIYIGTSTFEGWGMDIEYMKKHWANYINGQYKLDEKGILSSMYIDYHEDIISDNYIHLCRCKANVFIPNNKVANIVVSNSSDIIIDMVDFNIVYLYLLDDSKVHISSIPDKSDVVCYRYSEECTIIIGSTFGKFKETRKELKL